MPVSSTNNLIRPDRIFAEEGAKLEYVTTQCSPGPIYIGKKHVIMEGALIGVPLPLRRSKSKNGSKNLWTNHPGPFSKAGGEITNSVIIGYSNKVHEGYMGNSVMGEWCNIGQDSNTSNLKNNLYPGEGVGLCNRQIGRNRICNFAD